MYYELLILARLMYGPQHGYLIAKVANDTIGPWAKVSPGTLYPILAKLVRAGLIRESGTAPVSRRDPRTYAITTAGRERFRALMLDTETDPADYQRRFHLKVPTLEFLTLDERQQLFEHYADYCRATIRHLEQEARLLAQYGPDSGAISGAGIAAAVELMAHQADQWRAELVWAEQLRAQQTIPRVSPADSATATDDTPDTEPANAGRL